MELFEIAKRCTHAIRESAREMGVPVTACVVDSTGALVLLERMDRAIPVSVDMAQRKAVTAALMGQPTGELAALVQPGQPLFGLTHVAAGRFVAFGGGVPMTHEGALVGGVGVSGGSIEQDAQLAQIGAAKAAGTEPQ